MTQEERRIIVDLRTRMEHNLKTCILPFWTRYMTDQVHGGFYGRVDGSLQPDLSSPKSMVLNGRMLWTYSRAWDMVRYPACQELAQRAFRYIQSHPGKFLIQLLRRIAAVVGQKQIFFFLLMEPLNKLRHPRQNLITVIDHTIHIADKTCFFIKIDFLLNIHCLYSFPFK